MVKQVRYTYRGINQDITKSKHSPEFYFEAHNIRILATDSQSTMSVTNEKGNELKITIPPVVINTETNQITYNNKSLQYFEGSVQPEIEDIINSGQMSSSTSNQKIIGHTTSRDSILLFTTGSKNFDCIWEVTGFLSDDYDLNLLYCRNLNFSIENPIQAIFNYENEKIQKLYWVDGLNQLRFINIKHSVENGDNENLIDLNSNTLNLVGNFDLSQPVITDVVGGGTHTSGKIQYAYNLYRLNSSQTKISPLSKLIPLDKGVGAGGGELNEIVGSTPVIRIENLDLEYTNIKLYAIKYTSFNQLPTISLIADSNINSTGTFQYYDDGRVIEEVSTEEFVFLGSDPLIPEHIESKYNILFSANIKESNFEVPIDCRAYSFRDNRDTTFVLNNVRTTTNSLATFQDGIIGDIAGVNSSTYSLDIEHDAVNPNYDLYRYQADSLVVGGEGKYIKYELVQKSLTDEQARDKQFFKDDEIYRIGIQFYNKLGQKSLVEWIADFKAPIGNLQGNYNTLEVELKPEFYIWLNTTTFESENDIPVGYKIVRADRTISDRSILCQGGLTQMMTQATRNVSNYENYLNETYRANESESLVKFPITLSRGFISNIAPINKTNHLEMMNEQSDYGSSSINDNTEFPYEEIYSGKERGWKRQQSWQFTKMFQMHNPEVLFDEGLSLGNGLRINIRGLCKNTKNDIWYKRIDKTTEVEAMSRSYSNVTSFVEDSDIRFLALFGPSDDKAQMDFLLFNREYNTFLPASQILDRPILGSPEINERGAGIKSYNGDSTLKYKNSMRGFLTDRSDRSDDEAAIIDMNSFGSRTITMVEGSSQRWSLEQMFSNLGIADGDGILLGEIRIPKKNIYLGNIYGGNSIESKRRSTYIEIGEYKNLDSPSVEIDSPGDTFVSLYKFARLSKTDTEILDDQTLQTTEIVSCPVETTVDLKNRNDNSLFDWDSEFQPRYEQYHKYNRVYSQQPTLIQNLADDDKFKKVNNFDTRVIASKIKVPGESIDSWTDFLINETKDLDGKYGPINALINFNDNLFTLQDEGVAALSINPRIQVQGSDGVSIELGKGSILYDYKYLTTKSGSINKWSVISTNSGFYYYDALNKTWNRYSGSLEGLTDKHGLHSFFNDKVDYNVIKNDNPLIKQGITSGYNAITNDVFLTVLQDNPFTLCFNEMSNSFTSFYDYKPSIYINKGFKMITLNSDNNQLWEHFTGNYNSFYGQLYDSSIKFLVNPQERDCVFNNIEYKSELYNSTGDDISNSTLTHIKANNEYQVTAETPLILNSNLNRKFRMWRANIPREVIDDKPTLNRIRGHWMYLDLIFRNTSNQKLILHDMGVNYTAYN